MLYGSLFAAIGSASDQETDSQQFILPITIPLILSFVLVQVVIDNPHSGLAYWLSMIPFTSPIIMIARIPFGVPVHELVLSIALLIGGFLFTTWLAAKIYRVGILMYGKKLAIKNYGNGFKIQRLKDAIAIIDLGTNTFNLLICDKKDDTQKTIFKNKIAVKLGEGGIDKSMIADAPYQRGIKALETHLDNIKKYKVDKVRAFATSAIRSTKNGAEFVNEVFEKAGFKRLRVIDGDKEAELIYQGVKKVIQFNSNYKLIMDIGGGSTEFIIANSEGILWKKVIN